MNKCLLEVAMCKKCRSSDFQSEEGRRVRSLSTAARRGLKNFRTGGGLPIWRGGGIFAEGSVPHYMQCNFHLPNDPINSAKFKKKVLADAELQQCAIFGPNMDHLPQFLCGKLLSFSSTC